MGMFMLKLIKLDSDYIYKLNHNSFCTHSFFRLSVKHDYYGDHDALSIKHSVTTLQIQSNRGSDSYMPLLEVTDWNEGANRGVFYVLYDDSCGYITAYNHSQFMYIDDLLNYEEVSSDVLNIDKGTLLATRLKGARLQQKKSLYRLYNLTDITPAKLSELEGGITSYTKDDIICICDKLNLDSEAILKEYDGGYIV